MRWLHSEILSILFTKIGPSSKGLVFQVLVKSYYMPSQKCSIIFYRHRIAFRKIKRIRNRETNCVCVAFFLIFFWQRLGSTLWMYWVILMNCYVMSLISRGALGLEISTRLDQPGVWPDPAICRVDSLRQNFLYKSMFEPTRYRVNIKESVFTDHLIQVVHIELMITF